MAISVISTLTDDIVEILNKRAEAFAARHQDLASYVKAEREWAHPEAHSWALVDDAIHHMSFRDPERAAYLRRLWIRILQRATGTRATMIAYGYLACHVD